MLTIALRRQTLPSRLSAWPAGSSRYGAALPHWRQQYTLASISQPEHTGLRATRSVQAGLNHAHRARNSRVLLKNCRPVASDAAPLLQDGPRFLDRSADILHQDTQG